MKTLILLASLLGAWEAIPPPSPGDPIITQGEFDRPPTPQELGTLAHICQALGGYIAKIETPSGSWLVQCRVSRPKA